ncbi:alpha/beta fold hydrolase [Undibacterium sp. Di27W]|uniref:alpha/beta hydrolase family protein n=1 Tax=Undibacterium sp. Di27W TaxID=3413036 RepID=UPI003BF06BBC
MKTIHISTTDGLSVAASLFIPEGTPRAGVIINSATAVGRGFYAAFAEHLSKHGYLAISYDYRGIGDSLNVTADISKFSMRAWGELDFEAVIQWATSSFTNIEWHCVGHSVGGQLVGLAPSNSALHSVYCIAAQNGYWKNWGVKKRFKLLLTWYLLIPLLNRAFGHIPKHFFGEIIPGPIAKEWARWCRNPHYICDKNGEPLRSYFAQYTKKMLFLAIDDDLQFAPLKAVKALHDFYSNAEREIRRIEPEKFGLKKIGHFGFFKQKNKPLLWSDTLDWLNQFQ